MESIKLSPPPPISILPSPTKLILFIVFNDDEVKYPALLVKSPVSVGTEIFTVTSEEELAVNEFIVVLFF